MSFILYFIVCLIGAYALYLTAIILMHEFRESRANRTYRKAAEHDEFFDHITELRNDFD